MAYLYGLFYEDGEEDVCFYFGKGSNHRKDVHFTDCRLENDRNKHKTHKIKKLQREGKNPHSKILIDNLDDEIAYRVEKSVLERKDVFANLTNVMQGGRGVNHTEETRRKISEKMSGENNPNYGKKIRNGKLNERQAAEIKWVSKNTDVLCSEIAKRYPVKKGTVRQIGQDFTWKEIKPQKPKTENWWKKAKTRKDIFRESNGNISKKDAANIKWRCRNAGEDVQDVSKDYPISRSQVRRIKKDKRWADVKPIKPE